MTRTILAATVAAVTAIGAPATADEAADRAIKLRQQVMGGISASVGGLYSAVRGDEAARAIMAELGAMLAANADFAVTGFAFSMNTAGLSELRTTALPRIWDEPAEFEARRRTLAERTAELAALGADATEDDVKRVFEACKACHDDFREK